MAPRDDAAAGISGPAPSGGLLGWYWQSGVSCAVTCSTLFTIATICVKFAVRRVPLMEIVFVRASISLLLGLGWGLARGERPLMGGGEVRWLLACRGAFGSLSMTCLYAAVAHAPLGEATIVTYTAPALTALLAFVVLGEHFGFLTALGAAVSLFGVAAIALPNAVLGPWAAKDVVGGDGRGDVRPAEGGEGGEGAGAKGAGADEGGEASNAEAGDSVVDEASDAEASSATPSFASSLGKNLPSSVQGWLPSWLGGPGANGTLEDASASSRDDDAADDEGSAGSLASSGALGATHDDAAPFVSRDSDAAPQTTHEVSTEGTYDGSVSGTDVSREPTKATGAATGANAGDLGGEEATVKVGGGEGDDQSKEGGGAAAMKAGGTAGAVEEASETSSSSSRAAEGGSSDEAAAVEAKAGSVGGLTLGGRGGDADDMDASVGLPEDLGFVQQGKGANADANANGADEGAAGRETTLGRRRLAARGGAASAGRKLLGGRSARAGAAKQRRVVAGTADRASPRRDGANERTASAGAPLRPLVWSGFAGEVGVSGLDLFGPSAPHASVVNASSIGQNSASAGGAAFPGAALFGTGLPAPFAPGSVPSASLYPGALPAYARMLDGALIDPASTASGFSPISFWSVNSPHARTVGICFGLGSAMLAAMAYVSIRKIGKRESALVLANWFYSFSFVLASVSLLATVPSAPVVPTPLEALELLVVGVTSFFAQICLGRSLQLLPAAMATSVTLLQAAMLALSGVVVFAEPLTAGTVIGGALIVLGILAVAYDKKRHERSLSCDAVDDAEAVRALAPEENAPAAGGGAGGGTGAAADDWAPAARTPSSGRAAAADDWAPAARTPSSGRAADDDDWAPAARTPSSGRAAAADDWAPAARTPSSGRAAAADDWAPAAAPSSGLAGRGDDWGWDDDEDATSNGNGSASGASAARSATIGASPRATSSIELAEGFGRTPAVAPRASAEPGKPGRRGLALKTPKAHGRNGSLARTAGPTGSGATPTSPRPAANARRHPRGSLGAVRKGVAKPSARFSLGDDDDDDATKP